MRAFVALEIPDKEVIDRLVVMQGELAATGADLKTVEKENLHFTLRFLGEISQAQATQADSRLKLLSLKGSGVEIRGIGAFPSIQRPRVVWVGVGPEAEDKVGSIARAVFGALEGIGESDERPFRAHITLARVRSERNLQALAGLLRANSERAFGVSKLGALNLKSSTLTPKGPVYANIGEYPLL